MTILKLDQESIGILLGCLRFCAAHGRISPQQLVDILNNLTIVEDIENDN